MDLSDFWAEQSGPSTKCSVLLALNRLAPADKERAEAALAEETLHASAIQRWFKKRDIHLGDSSISRHRRGVCKCQR